MGDQTHVSTRVMGTYGYAAPEYVMTGEFCHNSVAELYYNDIIFFFCRKEMILLSFLIKTDDCLCMSRKKKLTQMTGTFSCRKEMILLYFLIKTDNCLSMSLKKN